MAEGGEERDAYARAGVDIAAGNEAVARYRERLAGWRHPNQVDQLGGFAGLFALPGDESRLLVGSTDGVGTKIIVAAQLERYSSVGGDLVNHCINDILVVNATPLFFLDYLAVGKLDPAIAAEIVGGVNDACRAAGIALLGGETAEMPGLYAPKHFDLAGTIVGEVKRADLPPIDTVTAGDAIVGLPSIGFHTNGYSLVRSVIGADEWRASFGAATFADAILAPHPSYYREVRAIQAVAHVKAMAHITGGGLLENVPRSLPAGVKAIFEQTRWSVPAIMQEVVERAELQHDECYRTLNMGVGYTLVVPMTDAAKALAAVPGARIVGWLETRKEGEAAVVVHPARG